MIVGHLPAGYIVSRLLFSRFERFRVSLKPFLWAGVLGAIAPDLDMLYFHLVDQRMHHHHTYVTHYPLLWGALLVACVVWFRASSVKRRAALAVIFSLNGFIHLFLDSIVGDVWWLAPFVDKPFAMFSVPALYEPWWLNFIFHWSFALEIFVLMAALYLWRQADFSRNAENPEH